MRGDRGEVASFSAGSKRRLKFTAGNAFPALISQFGMTYHVTSPDGRTIKRHLNNFLVTIRKLFPGVSYLWILEFQRRGTPHFHIFLGIMHDAKVGRVLGEIWNRIAEPDSKEHLRFHQHESNFVPWEMGSGSYLCKYLDKEHQKQIPEGFTGVGRFWGNSRGLVPPALTIETTDIDTAYMETGYSPSTYIVRTICKHHERSLRSFPWKSAARKAQTSYTLPNAAISVRKLLAYLDRQPMMEEPPPF